MELFDRSKSSVQVRPKWNGKLNKKSIDAIRLRNKGNGRYYYCEEVDDLLDAIGEAAEIKNARIRSLAGIEAQYNALAEQAEELTKAVAAKDAELKSVKAEYLESRSKSSATLESVKAELRRLREIETEYLENKRQLAETAEENQAIQQRLQDAEAAYLEKQKQADAAVAEHKVEFQRLQTVEAEYLEKKEGIAKLFISAQQDASAIVERERKRVLDELKAAVDQKNTLQQEITALTEHKQQLDEEMERTTAYFESRKEQLCGVLEQTLAALQKGVQDEDVRDAGEAIEPIPFPSNVRKLGNRSDTAAEN